MAESALDVLVIGDGGFGTCLALLLCRAGHRVRQWSAFPERAEELRRERENRRYLPGVPLPENLSFLADPFEAARGIDLALSVVPTQYLRSVARRFEDALDGRVPLISATKGLEIETFKRPSQILEETLGQRPLAVLSGPSHAEEVARGLPASVVVASRDAAFAERAQALLSGETFRVYSSGDPKGVELAGALKNVIAIAAGISDGLGLGDNAKAALLTRGMVEMARYGAYEGCQPETFFGLVGERIGRGESLEQILSGMLMVAEGVSTTRALFGPESEARSVSLPIASQVHAVLFEGKDPRQAVGELMRRSPASEMRGLGRGET